MAFYQSHSPKSYYYLSFKAGEALGNKSRTLILAPSPSVNSGQAYRRGSKSAPIYDISCGIPPASRRFMRAVRFGAVGVDVKRMLVNREAALLGDFGLTALYFGVDKLFHPATL